jgi:hypothetical protein
MEYFEFEKNKSNIVRISPSIYEGYEVMDIRIYAKNKSGEWVATPKGISINIDRVPDLIYGLEWALQKPCVESNFESSELMSIDKENELSETTHTILKKHGISVHWDTAEEMVLKLPNMKKFNKWQLHFVLTIRKDLFEYVGDGCFKAIT